MPPANSSSPHQSFQFGGIGFIPCRLLLLVTLLIGARLTSDAEVRTICLDRERFAAVAIADNDDVIVALIYSKIMLTSELESFCSN